MTHEFIKHETFASYSIKLGDGRIVGHITHDDEAAKWIVNFDEITFTHIGYKWLPDLESAKAWASSHMNDS
ncbi:MAG: hypothetical protein ABI999_12695 [Acidobacteriota bacterium]